MDGNKKMKSDEKPVEKSTTKSSGKLSDKQKADLKKHMDKLEMSTSEKRSHRMKMMAQMRKGHSVKKAHAAIMEK
jgi:hypothetical protein